MGEAAGAPAWVGHLAKQVGRVVVGQEEALRLLLTSLVAGGHALVEDVPGVGKTSLVKAVARSLDLTFRRIQFTPDLLPSDVTGITHYRPDTGEFVFRPGPVFTQVLLADEINRATPRTQSSLLEAMEERQVTVDGESRPLPEPFWVVATQNPVETQGTYPLPEAQLDRFLLRLGLGYPTPDLEAGLLIHSRPEDPSRDLAPVAGPEAIAALRKAAAAVRIAPAVAEYVVALVQASRHHPAIELGLSPRASLAMARAARAWAALEGRDHVLPDDVQRLAPYVWSHRLILAMASRLAGAPAAQVVGQLVAEVPAPREAPWPAAGAS